MKNISLLRSLRVAGILAFSAALWGGTSGVASASGSYSAIQDGCYGKLMIQSNYNGSGHDYASGYFDNMTIATGFTGWSCEFWLERSTDGGSTWSQISGYHTGSGSDQGTYWYYDGPGYMARVGIMATNSAGTFAHFDYTAGY